MKIDFLCRDDNNTRLILIYAGWSAGPSIAADVRMEGWDVAVVHDFTDLCLDVSFLQGYYTVYLFAWSLGVYAASVTLPSDRVTAAFAINGTLSPVDDSHGIPAAVFRGTAAGLDARNLMKFRMRMMSGRSEWEERKYLFDDVADSDRIENLRHQLEVVDNACVDDAGRGALPWVRAYIGEDDRIFPAVNQKKAWSLDPDVETVTIKAPHYVDISGIIRGVIADPQKVSQKFSKASVTYDTHAIAQYSAAIKLADKLREASPGTGGDVLEIGCGTGLFTREYARVLQPARATFVDITETGPFYIAPEERYVVDDAERWIERQADNSHDVIVSASCIQWFADLPRFLRNCSRCLRPGGVIAVSTFLPGNMEELDTLRPSPMIYPKVDKLRSWLELWFEEIGITEDCIRVEFRSVREMLMHLKHTGVGGSAPSGGLTVSAMSGLRSLTYRPVYITARSRKRNIQA